MQKNKLHFDILMCVLSVSVFSIYDVYIIIYNNNNNNNNNNL